MYSFLLVVQMIISFFGHSNYTVNYDDKILIFNFLNTLPQSEEIDFYFGGYGEFDNFCYKCIKEYKLSHPNCKLIFITPYINEWLNERKLTLIEKYDEIIYPEIECVPIKFAILKRNEWIVKKSNYIIFYVNTHFGGAYKTMLYAHKQHKPYINIYQGNYDLY